MIICGSHGSQVGVRDGRGLREDQGNTFILQMGAGRQYKNQTSYQHSTIISTVLIFYLSWLILTQKSIYTSIGKTAYEAAWPWMHYLVSLGLSFVVCKMEIILDWQTVVMISEVLLCCSILRSTIGNIINETGTAVLFL